MESGSRLERDGMILFRKLLCLNYVAVLAVMTMCVFNFLMAPLVMCLLDQFCLKVSPTLIQDMYPKSVAIACFVSFSTLLRKYRKSVVFYDGNVEVCQSYSSRRGREPVFRNRGLCTMAACLLLILATHLSRLIILYEQNSAPVILVFFVFMYTENVCTFLTEAHFVKLCFRLENEFAHVNRDLTELGKEFLAIDPITATVTTAAAAVAEVDDSATAGSRPPDRRVTYSRDFYGSRNGGQHSSSAANVVEIIRIRHRLIRDAYSALADMYSTPMGMSVLVLCSMTLFDIYYQVYNFMGADSRPSMFIYLWLIQYSVRFYTIVVAAHNTTAQALKTKIIVTDINNRYLDDNTKEELLLFFNQLSCCPIEFTACDFFTMNTHLITSAIAGGTTYLVILLQFSTEYK